MRKTMILGVLAASLIWMPPYLPSPRQLKEVVSGFIAWVTLSLLHVRPKVVP